MAIKRIFFVLSNAKPHGEHSDCSVAGTTPPTLSLPSSPFPAIVVTIFFENSI
jgi:hypothetical protein